MNDVAATVSAPRVYPVPAHRVRMFEERFAALVRRAVKLGCEVPSYTIGEVVTEERRVQDLDGETFIEYVEFVPVAVSGASVRFGGWTFLAVVDYETSVPTFRKTPSAGDADLPLRFRSMGPVCEHCRASRQRKETFIVAHEDGRILQVGRQCIKDFLGGNTPDNVAALAAFESDVHAACSGEDGGFMGEPPFMPEVGAYLSWVVRAANAWGWVSRSAASDFGGKQATATVAAESMRAYIKACKEGRADRAAKPNEADKARAAEILAWARSLGDGSDRPLGDYQHNLRAVCSLGRVGYKQFGIAASAVSAFDREAARRRSVLNEHVGTVGGKLEGVRVFVDKVLGTDSAYGASIVLMRDTVGHQFKWFTANVPDTGKEYTMKATVKAHSHWNGVLQTIVTRAELQADDEPTKAESKRAEALDRAIYDACRTLMCEPIRWGGWDEFNKRRAAAFEETNLVDLETIRADVYELAAIAEPSMEPADDDARRMVDLARRSVRAQLATFAPGFTRRKLSASGRSRATLLVERIGNAANEVAAWPLHSSVGAMFREIATAKSDDLATLESLVTEFRSVVPSLTLRIYTHISPSESTETRAAERRAAAMTALDVGEPVAPVRKTKKAAAAHSSDKAA